VDAAGQQILKASKCRYFLLSACVAGAQWLYEWTGEDTRARHRPVACAPQITAPNGAVYTMFFPPVRDPSLAILGAPSLQFLLLSIALVVSGVICWYLARSVTRPVERLQASARALAGGNLKCSRRR